MKTTIISTITVLLTTLAVHHAQASGFIIISEGQTKVVPVVLQERSKTVKVEINDLVSKTNTEQIFFNPTGRRLEGHFIFPIPKGAVIDDFTMEIEGQDTRGELLDAGTARKIYEDIVRKMRDPAILEYADRQMFKVRIFPIEPHKEKRVNFSYTETLVKNNGNVSYSFNTKSYKNAAGQAGKFNMEIDLFSKHELKNVYCPTHDVNIERKSPHHATVHFQSNSNNRHNDLNLVYHTDQNPVGLSMLTHKQTSEAGYFFIDINPGMTEQKRIIDKDVTFVLDVSGSMAGEKMKQAKNALNFCVNNLNSGDRFEIIRFSTEANPLFSGLAPANEINREKASKFITGLKAIGGTNMEQALTKALNNHKESTRPHIIIFITDGKPTIGERKENALVSMVERSNSQSTRIFTFGVGNEINTHLLDKFTEITNAYRTYVSPSEDIEIKVSDFFTKVSSPVLTDIGLKINGHSMIHDIYPKRIPDLFKGNSVTVFGRYDQAWQNELLLTGMVNGKKTSFKYEVNLSEENERHNFIPKLWATRAVGYLLDEIRLHGETTELKDEVVRIARDHGIVTPYTTYLILEDERTNPAWLSAGDALPPSGALFDRDLLSNEEFNLANEQEYELVKMERHGKVGIGVSKEIQQLNVSGNVAMAQEYEPALDYKTKSGEYRNLATENQIVNGRTMYNNGNAWVEAKAREKKNLKKQRIQFASKEYFDFLNTNSEASAYMALGRNVQFIQGDRLIEVFE